MAGRFVLYTDADVQGLDRVLVTNDGDQKRIAFEWYVVGRPFPGLIWWPQTQYRLMRPGDFVKRFEEYAQQANHFADLPVLHLKPYA